MIGARPNYMKIAPIFRALRPLAAFEQYLVHTGQHYGADMSEAFFADLDIPAPDINLQVGSASHAVQTGSVMARFEPVLRDLEPDLVVVVGDVNSTLACALTAKKLGIRVAHVEAGLRSFDDSMPEEINRVLTDRLSDLLFTTEVSGNEHLRQEGVPGDRIHFVGNVMIDSLVRTLPKARGSDVLARLGVPEDRYLLATIHRPSNVDGARELNDVLYTLEEAARRLPLLLPLHPRTRASLAAHGLESRLQAIAGATVCGPLGYVDFLRCQMSARAILTDSGGIQEESTWLGVPCLTMRPNTERPSTISSGSNRLIGTEPAAVLTALDEALAAPARTDRRPELWDGRAAERIAGVLASELPQAQARKLAAQVG